MLTVRISHWNDTYNRRERETTLGPFKTLTEAQLAYINLRDSLDLGASGLSSGEVYEDGQHVARISYNGRAWAPVDWSVGMAPIAEAPVIVGGIA